MIVDYLNPRRRGKPPRRSSPHSPAITDRLSVRSEGAPIVTNPVPDDSVGATDQETRRPDELEDWLTDLRVTLNDDPPGWLTPEDEAADPDSVSPPPAAGTPAHSARADGDLKNDPPSPIVGRHRAAE